MIKRSNYFKKLLIISFSALLTIFFFSSNLNAADQSNTYYSEYNVNIIESAETPPRILSDESPGPIINIPNDADEFLWSSANQPVSLSITIIESQSKHPEHNMDTRWQSVVTAMGHIGTVVPQTTLDNTNFFSTTDILIISSGVINIPSNRRAIIMQYIEQGGPVYIQGEYQSTFDSNIVFESIVNSLGGSFSWTGTFAGNLTPMNVLGELSNTPNVVSALQYFWYGCAGSGDITIENYLEYQSQHFFGFIFSPPDSAYGTVITNSDQDWVRNTNGYPEVNLLMENIITRLASDLFALVSPPCGSDLSTPPYFFWTPGNYDYFKLYSVFNYTGLGYYPIPIGWYPSFTGFQMPQNWWNAISGGSTNIWAVAGYSSITDQWELTDWCWFTKNSEGK